MSEIEKELVKQKRKADTGAVEAVDISRADNGYTVRVRRASTPSTKSAGPCDASYSSPKESVFTSVDAMLEFVNDILS